MGIGGLSPGVRLPVLEAIHSPTSSAEVKNEWSYTSTHQGYAIMAYTGTPLLARMNRNVDGH
jgi:hypothetical protein